MARKLEYFGHIAKKKMFDFSRYGARGWQKAHWVDDNLRTRLNGAESTKASQDWRQWWSTVTLITATQLINISWCTDRMVVGVMLVSR